VHDGDTIKVRLNSGPLSVRFFGIDAPELKQAQGAASRNTLARLVEDKIVDMEPIGQTSYDREQSGRLCPGGTGHQGYRPICRSRRNASGGVHISSHFPAIANPPRGQPKL
jgi:hypothetical protein